MALLEGAEAARATATGMAAVTAALLAPAEGRRPCRRRARRCSAPAAMSSRTCCRASASTSTLVDGRDLDAWQSGGAAEHQGFFLESPTNPTLEVLDIAAVAEIAHAAGARLVVDNVFATPLCRAR